MRIRQLTAQDAAIFWPVRLRALREDPDAFGSTYEESKDRPLEDVARRLVEGNDDGSCTLGAFDDAGQLVGTLRLGRETQSRFRHIAGIYGMYVAPEVRGQRIGQELLDAAIARARQIPELEQLFLNVVTTNTSALALYRRVGFISFGVIPHAMKLPEGRYLDEEQMVYWLR